MYGIHGSILLFNTVDIQNNNIINSRRKENKQQSFNEMLDVADNINHGVGFDNSLVMKYLNIFKENLGTN